MESRQDYPALLVLLPISILPHPASMARLTLPPGFTVPGPSSQCPQRSCERHQADKQQRRRLAAGGLNETEAATATAENLQERRKVEEAYVLGLRKLASRPQQDGGAALGYDIAPSFVEEPD